MGDELLAAISIAGDAVGGIGILFALIAFTTVFLALFLFWLYEVRKPLALSRFAENPLLSPNAKNWWESQAVFNPAAIVEGDRVHLLYRALGEDGISRIGYASSKDGINFDERLPYPVYQPERDFGTPHRKRIYGPLSYSTVEYPSGGGWGGCEDPRLVKLEGKAYMTFVAFDGWGFVRMAFTSLPLGNFLAKEWVWQAPALLSPPGEIHKNWVLFPEKIHGKYAILHSVSPSIAIEYVDTLDVFDGKKFIRSSGRHGGREGHWDKAVRGAGAPPLKTDEGWLLFYHGFDPAHPNMGYKVGAMLLDLRNPSKVLYRSAQPVLEAKEWYENDWKPGVTYASGAVIKDENIIVYYGGGDKHIAAAKANLRDFLHKLMHYEHATLEPVHVKN